MTEGDRVRITEAHPSRALRGEVGIIRRIQQEGNVSVALLEMEDGTELRCGKPGWMEPAEPVGAESLPEGLSAPALVEWLKGIGVRLWVEGEALRFEGPPGIVTPDIIDRLKGAKGSLLRLLGPEMPMTCFVCGIEIPQGAPAGDGPLMVIGPPPVCALRFYHLRAECLPADRRYNPETGMVERIQS